MKSVTMRDRLRQLFRPARKTPARPKAFRPMLEFLEGRTVLSPVVTGLSPNYGPTSGGVGVIVSGSGFTGATVVSFGSVPAAGYYVQSDTQIEAYDPSHAAGVVDVVVTAPSGTSPVVPADEFTYQVVLTATSTMLYSSADPSSFNQSVTFTAMVSPNGSGTPTGTVTFMDGATALGTGTLSGGLATFATSALALGTHLITVVYSGDGSFAGSTSSVVTQNVDSATAYIWFGSINSETSC
mgnify:CR=1 FL=1